MEDISRQRNSAGRTGAHLCRTHDRHRRNAAPEARHVADGNRCARARRYGGGDDGRDVKGRTKADGADQGRRPDRTNRR